MSAIIAATLVVLVFTCTESVTAHKKDQGVSGLYPFPRVGRRDPCQALVKEFIKRQGLIPFPRVGRGGSPLIKERTLEDNVVRSDASPGEIFNFQAPQGKLFYQAKEPMPAVEYQTMDDERGLSDTDENKSRW